PRTDTLSLHDALPILHAGYGQFIPETAVALCVGAQQQEKKQYGAYNFFHLFSDDRLILPGVGTQFNVSVFHHRICTITYPIAQIDRKSTRLNSSHVKI